jgi:hypothetical protein
MWFHPLHPSQFLAGLFNMDGGRDSPTNQTNPPPFIGDVPMFSHWNLHLFLDFPATTRIPGIPPASVGQKNDLSFRSVLILASEDGRERSHSSSLSKGCWWVKGFQKNMNGMYRSSHGMGFHQSISVYNFGFIISEIANDSNIIYTYQDPFSGSTIFKNSSFLKSAIPFGVVPVRPVKQRNFASCHQRQQKGNWRVSSLW